MCIERASFFGKNAGRRDLLWQLLRALMSSQRTDLAEQLASMPELQALLTAERAAMEAKIEALKKEHALAAQQVVDLTVERDKLRASHERLWVEVELFKRRLFIAKAEREVRVVIARVRYKTVDAAGNADVITTPMPNEMLPSSIVAPFARRARHHGERGQGIAAVQDRRLL